VKSIFSPSEPLTPGILYVGVVTLTGTVLTRTRSLPTRLFIPPVFFLTSFHHFLPQTSANLGAYVFSLERAYMPMVAERHENMDASIRKGWMGVRNVVGEGRGRVTSAAETVVNRVQGATGLKLRETFGAGRDEDTSTKKS
jgi:organizing structure protein 2